MDLIIIPVAIMVSLAILSGILLSLAAKHFAVAVDERFAPIRELLPGANCGACGYAGCDAYATALLTGAKTNLCTPGGSDTAKAVSAALGVSAEEVVERYAVVRCSGTQDKTQYGMDFEGPRTCEASNFFYRGRGTCSFSCLGYGDCVTVCPHDAIFIDNGVAVVDKNRCIGCGLCVKKCPKQIINLIPKSNDVAVCCSSTAKGGVVRKICAAGCIGCKRCEKACQFEAITVTNNLAVIDPSKCTNCQACVAECPTKVIHVDDGVYVQLKQAQ